MKLLPKCPACGRVSDGVPYRCAEHGAFVVSVAPNVEQGLVGVAQLLIGPDYVVAKKIELLRHGLITVQDAKHLGMEVVPVTMERIPPAGAITAHEVPGHVFVDTERLSNGWTHFFQNTRAFLHDYSGKSVLECNLPGPGGCVPQGMLKRVTGVRVELDKREIPAGATVKVKIYGYSPETVPPWWEGECVPGQRQKTPLTIKGVPEGGPRVRDREVKDGVIELLPLETFGVSVLAPDFAGVKAQVHLYGPLLSSNER